MHKKLIFFDIDGTLTSVKEPGKILDSTKEALSKLQENGHFVALATGRAKFRAQQFQNEIGIKNMVCEGGNCIIIDHQELSYEPLDQSLAKSIYYEAIEKGIGVAVSTSDDRIRYTPNNNFLDQAGDFQSFMEVVVDKNYQIEHQPPIRRLFVSLKRDEKDYMKSIEKIGVMHYGDDQFIIVEPDDKFKGIRKICKYLNKDINDVIVFGDGLNDRKMFQEAPFKIAMGNAIPELKKMADYVTADSDADGIYKACKHFGWIS